jgi:alanine racemase
LLKQPFYRDTWAEIQLDSLYENVQKMINYLPSNVQVMAVVKANAYGHGDVQVAKTALEAGATQLAVAILDEALALRWKGITAPILVLGASRPEDVEIAAKNDISLTVFSLQWLQQAKAHLKKGDRVRIHIKCDTGMGRIGVRNEKELNALVEYVEKNDEFIWEGIFSHFATADETNQEYVQQQMLRFEQMLTALKQRPPFVHMANSAAAMRYQTHYWNMIRLGIAMYGLTPSLAMVNKLPFPLTEVFSLHTRLVQVKKIKKGESISYGATYTAQEDEWIGTLPIGYADGWIRKLQGQEVLVEGKRAPIVGRICMDQCMIKLPYEMPIGTKVTLIGKQGNEKITVDEIAQKLDTINYEVPCMISARVPRVFVRQGQYEEIENYLFSLGNLRNLHEK